MAEFPHCNTQVLHAPGECHYCDHYPALQRARMAGGTPFTPNESNGWSGNVAVKSGEVHIHMGSSYVVGGEGPTCSLPPRGFFCNLQAGHDGPCPAYARLWKKIYLYAKTRVWWP